MKILRNILFFFLAASSGLASAQTGQGSILLGGGSNISSGFSVISSDDDSGVNISFNLSPLAGVFVKDNFAIGTELEMGFSVYGEEDYSRVTSILAAFPFVRYYFGSAKVKPFLNASIGGGVERSESSYTDSDDTISTKSNVFGIDLGGGVSIFLNKSVALDIGGAIVSRSYKSDSVFNEDYRETGFALNVGFSVFL